MSEAIHCSVRLHRDGTECGTLLLAGCPMLVAVPSQHFSRSAAPLAPHGRKARAPPAPRTNRFRIGRQLRRDPSLGLFER